MFLCERMGELHLPATLSVAEQCFPYDIGFRWSLPAATAPDRTGHVRQAARLAEIHQWVVRADFDAVAATFGLYRPADELAERERLLLLNWFCVNPRFQGRGLGRHLWTETVSNARQLGARRLVFYSSNEPEHFAADRLYVGAGCSRRIGPPLRDCSDRLTFFDLPLGDTPPPDRELVAEIDALLERYYAVDGDPALVALAETVPGLGVLSVAA